MIGQRKSAGFARRGVVEGFYGRRWSAAERVALFEFGAARGMNAYLYAPKDDPYHRARWEAPYPERLWAELCDLIGEARRRRIEFIYAFHPGRRLRFSAPQPVARLRDKARRLYEAGVQAFAVLFDDIPSRLVFPADRKRYGRSLALAEADWMGRVVAAAKDLRGAEWWLCPSYYSEDPKLARVFGPFEKNFLRTLAKNLPSEVACLWTGPRVVAKRISYGHMRKVARRLGRRVILWDNYPVNDLAMRGELHIGPLRGRDPRLPEVVHGYFSNPMLQPTLSLLPLATCFDYAADPARYDPEESWRRAVAERFGADALPYWRAIRDFCEKQGPPSAPPRRENLLAALRYARGQAATPWFRELRPWLRSISRALAISAR